MEVRANDCPLPNTSRQTFKTKIILALKLHAMKAFREIRVKLHSFLPRQKTEGNFNSSTFNTQNTFIENMNVKAFTRNWK